MKITVLDTNTLGEDLSMEPLCAIGECTVYESTMPAQVVERISDCDVVVLNKVKLGRDTLCHAKCLRLICVTATGYDNIDVDFCREKGIAVCNVAGYSSHSVALVTVASVLHLATHLGEYAAYTASGAYSVSGAANRLTPVYHELYGKTWGIVGYGNIGREVGAVAKALGCKVLVCKRNPVSDADCVDLDVLCRTADIITVHTPLTAQTRGLIGKTQLAEMKPNVILYNAARGAVLDEAAIAEAVLSGKIGAFGTDVYAEEPFPTTHPFYNIKSLPNVLLTPHMAWGAYEARIRCLNEIVLNIEDFYAGGKRSRVDL